MRADRDRQAAGRHARPARLRQRHAHRAHHSPARRELRVRPLPEEHLRQRPGHGGRRQRPRLHAREGRCGARADPVPGPGGGLGRLAADLHPAVRDLPRRGRGAHGGDPAGGEQRRVRRACRSSELRRRSAINMDVAGAAMRASLDYAAANRTSLVADQIEVFRRGGAGAAQVPVSPETVPGVPGIGPEDVYTTDFPRAYVIPAGAKASARPPPPPGSSTTCSPTTSRSRRATRDFRLGGKTYAKGSYVVDLRQPKRGHGQRDAGGRAGHQRQGVA